eukprot:3801999-Lingulodinium_polyedra.AAC.1
MLAAGIAAAARDPGLGARCLQGPHEAIEGPCRTKFLAAPPRRIEFAWLHFRVASRLVGGSVARCVEGFAL